jgi:hypothetical protein
LHAPAAHLERLTRGLRTAQKNATDPDEDHGVRPAPKPRASKQISWSWDCVTGELVLNGRLAPADGARLLAAASRTGLHLNRHDEHPGAENAPGPIAAPEPTVHGSAEHSPQAPSGSADPDRTFDGSGEPRESTERAAPDPAAGDSAQPSAGPTSAPSDPEPALTTRPPSDLGPVLLAMADMVCAGLPAPTHAPAADVLVTVDIDTLIEAFATVPTSDHPSPQASPTSTSTSGSTEDSAATSTPNSTAMSTPGSAATSTPGSAATSTPDLAADSTATSTPDSTADVTSKSTPDSTTDPGEALRTRATDHGARLDDGPALTGACLRRLVDDGRLRFAVTAADGRILNMTRASRTPSASQFRALWRRDHGCAVPGCGRTRFLHAHHVVFWSHGGKTILDNLVLLCGEHHRALHEGAFTITALGRQQFRFTGPDGITTTPAPTIQGNADDIATEHADITPATIQPDWDGRPLHSWAVAADLATWKEAVSRDRIREARAGDARGAEEGAGRVGAGLDRAEEPASGKRADQSQAA